MSQISQISDSLCAYENIVLEVFFPSTSKKNDSMTKNCAQFLFPVIYQYKVLAWMVIGSNQT